MLHQFASGLLHEVAAPAADAGKRVQFLQFPDKVASVQVALSFPGYDIISYDRR